MHPQIIKLEQLLQEARNNNKPASLNKFFDELWRSGVFTPAAEIRSLVTKLYEWMSPLQQQQPGNYALAVFALAFAAFHEGKYEDSLRDCTRAQKLFADLKNEDYVQACSILTGSNYRSLGEIELPMKFFLEAHQHLSATGANNVFHTFGVYMLAEMYNETHHFDQALHFYEIAIPLAQNFGNEYMLARGYLGMGVVYEHQKKYALALDYFNKALQLCETEDGQLVKSRVLTDMGTYYFHMGDLETSIRYQKEALDIREKLKLLNAPITNLIHLGEIYRAQGKFDDAIATLNKGLLIAEELKVKAKVFQIHSILSDTYQARGDAARCLFHYKAFHQVREEVMHENNERKIKNLHLVFEAEQTKKENVIIKAQKKEIENKNIQLQETLDELTITRVSRKAKILTLVVGALLIVAQEPIFHFVLTSIGENFYLSVLAKVVIILSLKPIDIAIENYLLRRIVLKKKKPALVHAS